MSATKCSRQTLTTPECGRTFLTRPGLDSDLDPQRLVTISCHPIPTIRFVACGFAMVSYDNIVIASRPLRLNPISKAEQCIDASFATVSNDSIVVASRPLTLKSIKQGEQCIDASSQGTMCCILALLSFFLSYWPAAYPVQVSLCCQLGWHTAGNQGTQ